MTYWSTLPPTPPQLNAISTYEAAYGVKIEVSNKQDAHHVISVFVPKQMLIFNKDGCIDGTNIKYHIVDSELFNNNPHNDWIKENVKSISISKDGKTATLSIKRSNSNDILKCLNNNMSKLLDEESLSDYEDSLGYLSGDELERERDLFGVDPIASGLL